MFRFDHFSRRLFTSFQFARGYDQLENWTTIIFVRIPSVACMSHLPRPTTLSWAAYGTSPYNCTKQCVREHIYTHTHNNKKKSNRTNNNAIRNKQRTTKKFQKTNCCCGSRDKRCYYCCYGNRVLPLVNSATGTMRTVTYLIFIIFFHGVWNMALVTMVTSRSRNHNISCKPCTWDEEICGVLYFFFIFSLLRPGTLSYEGNDR